MSVLERLVREYAVGIVLRPTGCLIFTASCSYTQGIQFPHASISVTAKLGEKGPLWMTHEDFVFIA